MIAVLRLPVDSSDLVSVGYDPKARVLEIEFKEQRIYQYQDVSPDVYERFLRADSYGEFFFANINKHYRYTRVEDVSEKAADSAKVALISGNRDKLRALRAACDLFKIEVEHLDLPVDEIQSHDSEKIALHKAKEAFRLAGRPVLIQDTYWNILALRGFPGAYMHDVSAWFRPEDFLALLHEKSDRTIICTHTVIYYDGKRSKVFSKDFNRTIAAEPHGKGESIDQIVLADGQRTIAEIKESGTGFSIPVEDSVWYEFAKWYNLQRRLGKV